MFRRAVAVVACSLSLVLGITLIGGSAHAIAPYPAYGTATVDGNPSEWNASISGPDFFAPMYTGSDPTKTILSYGYLRYDCSAGRMYVLVLKAPGSVIMLDTDASSANAWAIVNGDRTDKVYNAFGKGEFAWVNPDPSTGTADGYEASFPLSSGTTELTLGVHAEANGSQTSAFAGTVGKDFTGGIAVDIDCVANATTTSTTSAPQETTTTTTPPRADLTVAAYAATSYTRDFHWAIAKSADTTTFKQVGGSVTAHYTVTANQTGYVDSAWHTSGTITVTNPNRDPVTGVTVVASVDNGGTCAVSGGSGIDVASTTTLGYDCAYSNAPMASTGTVTATATWSAAANNTISGAASATATGTFGDPTTVLHGSMTVNDSMAGVLGTLAASVATPASLTSNYPETFTVPTWNCEAHVNTASLAETGQSASVTVNVCGPVKTGALTIGFWQNKNGQALITGGASTNGVCNSATYLNSFNPFKDLGLVSCAKVGTYVTNVIKAANAGGASMNAMLKAQTLATALDVYLAGTPGTVAIDLTKVCASPSSCATYESESAAFGGASSLTISQALSAAASASNAGGSLWYGNVKATQQLAKDLFDAINNQVAFSA